MDLVNPIFFLIVRSFTLLGNIFPQALICAFIMFFVDFEKGYYITGLWGWSYFLNLVIKNLVREARPDPKLHKIKVKGYSFPSGHAMTSWALYVSIASYFELGLLWTTLLYAMPILLGLTRIYFKVHYPHDVLAGWLISAVYLFFCEGFLNSFHANFYPMVTKILGLLSFF